MKWVLWIVLLVFGLMSGGWMTFDALRRLFTGDYVRIAGQLGPWQHLFLALGVNPMGGPVAVLFLVCGAARLAATAGLLVRAPWGWEASLITAAATLWFLPVGTVTSVLTIALLFSPQVRSMFSGG